MFIAQTQSENWFDDETQSHRTQVRNNPASTVSRPAKAVLRYRFSPSLSELVFESSVPYSKILDSYQGWISKVKKRLPRLSG
jgi:hypothetical protein